MDAVEKIAAAVLYEGYVLWPYRRSALKNQARWTFGGVFPRPYSEAARSGDAWVMQAQCLVTGERPVVQVRIHFLQVVERQVCRRNGDGTIEPVDELQVGGERYLTWEEAREQSVLIEDLDVTSCSASRHIPIHVPAGSAEEPLIGPDGDTAGALVRRWEALEGVVEVEAQPLREGLFQLTVRVLNTGPWNGEARARVLRRTFVATHAILNVREGEFVSLTDPPPGLEEAAASCENVGVWPVLAGEEGDRHTLLASPIILSDYPKIAPESPGDLFDGGEIDQLLILNILTLTDAEKEEMRATDPRVREILERCEALTSDDLTRLHGTMRDVRYGIQDTRYGTRDTGFRIQDAEGTGPDKIDGGPQSRQAISSQHPLHHPSSIHHPASRIADLEPPETVVVDGTTLRAGSRVRLRPRAGADIFDRALAGRIGIIASIEQDFEERIHLSVVVEEDPGQDLGLERMPGHRFFFAPEEVEPLGADAGCGIRETGCVMLDTGYTIATPDLTEPASSILHPVSSIQHLTPPLPHPAPRILVAGIGNVFLADDGFGVEVARRLAGRSLPESVRVMDAGIRGMDLVYALLEDYDAAILVDTAARGGEPGTLYLIEAQPGEEVTLDAHGMDPAKVLALAQALGAPPRPAFVVGCEPGRLIEGAPDEELIADLSPPVRAAVDGAVEMVEGLIGRLTTDHRP